MKNKIAVAGRSNVGKSSLIRAITGAKLRVGKKPGVTLTPREIPYKAGYILVDLPGFGFMRGVDRSYQEKVKDFIIDFLENNQEIALAIEVINLVSFEEIAQRWDKRGMIPFEVELFQFLQELDLNPIVVANKIDKIPRRELDAKLNSLSRWLGLGEDWKEHRDTIAPVSAKKKIGIRELVHLINKKLGI